MKAIPLKDFPETAANSGYLFARHFSAFIGRKAIAGDVSGYLESLACLLVYLQSDGHVCLDLQKTPVVQFGNSYYEIKMPPMKTLIGDLDLHKGNIVGFSDNPGLAPLVLQNGRYLYLQRYWRYEQEVVSKIHELMTATNRSDINFPDILFSDDDKGARQVQAVSKALQSRLSIIAGGPGTGKTTIAVKVIAANLIHDTNMAIALAAPTGKAAARMKESIGHNIGEMKIDDEIQQMVRGLETYTLHRLLGARFQSPYFKHDNSNPLPHDLLIVDESSMIDLPMMAKLLDAVGAKTTVVLIGDPNQLPPVEVGSVFRQIVSHPAASGLVTTLEENFRSKEAPDIIKLCEHINAGNIDGTQAILNSGSDQVIWKKIGSEKDTETIIKEGATQYRRLLRENETGRSILNNSRQFRILTALRKGPFGNESFNSRIKARLDTEKELILITHNDPDNDIFNGDFGVKMIEADSEIIWIEGRKLPISPLRIPEFQLAYAMTGHKAQGSEFDEVHIVLPTDQNCPILTREWLYTAASRAKRSVTIWSSEAALRKCVTTAVERSSGLYQQ